MQPRFAKIALIAAFALFGPALLPGCSGGAGLGPARSSKLAGKLLGQGFESSDKQFDLKPTRYHSAKHTDEGVLVSTGSLASGVSPIWFTGAVPRDFDLELGANLLDAAPDSGWGVLFGGKDRKYGYRAMVYGSGRLCVDRLFDTYPQFIHCVGLQPEVVKGESYNRIRVRVTGYRIRIWVNGLETLSFDDDRYEGGALALAVAGAKTEVLFRLWQYAKVR